MIELLFFKILDGGKAVDDSKRYAVGIIKDGKLHLTQVQIWKRSGSHNQTPWIIFIYNKYSVNMKIFSNLFRKREISIFELDPLLDIRYTS